LPLLFSILAVRLFLQNIRDCRTWLKTLGAAIVLTIAIGGWHYLTLYQQFGKALTGNWDPAIAQWWQQAGYRTPSYYLTFGQSLVRPFFSGYHSFWDALYSTFWGDGLCAGRLELYARPPWNYDLMVAGFILALAPTAILLTGFARVLRRCWRTAELQWLLLAGLPLLYGFAILVMSLKLPSYSQAKAFYGLGAMLPLAVFGVLGMEYWMARGQIVRNIFCLPLVLWLVTVYASFWIRPNTPETLLSTAIAQFFFDNEKNCSATLAKLQETDPKNAAPDLWLALIELRDGHPRAGELRLKRELREHPDNIRAQINLANALYSQTNLTEAESVIHRAIELAPDDPGAWQILCQTAIDNKQYDEAIDAGKQALSLDPYDGNAHYEIGCALATVGRGDDAVTHFSVVDSHESCYASAQFYTGVLLASQPGKRESAIAHIKEALRVEPAHPDWRSMLEKLIKDNPHGPV